MDLTQEARRPSVPNTVAGMARRSVWLGKETCQLLERLAPAFGSREAALREALHRLTAEEDRKEAVDAFFAALQTADVPLSNEEVSALAERCGL